MSEGVRVLPNVNIRPHLSNVSRGRWSHAAVITGAGRSSVTMEVELVIEEVDSADARIKK